MPNPLRNILFWIHLVSGLIVGLVVGVMSFTGVALAFESQIVEHADRSARLGATAPEGARRLTLEEMLAKVKEARPGVQPGGVTVYAEPDSRVAVSTGRGSAVYVHPFTGEVSEQGAQGWRAFFSKMEDLHRWLAASGDHRAVGKAITGVSNLAFLFLGVTGLFLWWPRKWKLRALRPTLWFRRGLKGKARDFNWHNVIGFWSLPVLLVLTASGAVISYKWASNLVFTLTGNPPPNAQGPIQAPPVAVPTPPPGSAPQGLDAQLAAAMRESHGWETITLRLPGAQGPGGQGGQGAPRVEGLRAVEVAPALKVGVAKALHAVKVARALRAAGGEGAPKGPQASAFTVREQDRWPLFASKTVSVDPFTARSLRTETYADFNSGRKLRTWLRFLHTGEALGWGGQLIAALASFGALFLVYTGYALSWRRFFPRRRAAMETASTPPTAPADSETNAA